MTTILIKKKDTAGAPAPGDLTNAAGGTEIAVNTATKRIYTKDSGGNVVELGTNASASTIDQLTVTTSATLSYGTANGVAYLNGSKVLTTGSALTFDGTNFATTGTVTSAGASNSGNLAFTGTGNRITGDFSNATAANRVAFQTSTVDGNTSIEVIPNGTATGTSLLLENSSGLVNASFLQATIDTASASIRSGLRGTGAFLPLTFFTSASERVRIDTAGNVGIGTSSPSQKLDVNGVSRLADSIYGVGSIELGSQGTGDRVAYLDFHSSGTPGAIDNSARIIRNAGVNGSLSIEQTGTGSIDFVNGGSQRLTITSAGNVGIGTSSPYSKLDVYSTIVSPTTGEATGVGSIRITNGASGLADAGGLEFKNAGDSSGYGAKIQSLNSGGPQLVFATRSGTATWSERMRIDSSGNVAIGTATTTNGNLTVQQASATTGGPILSLWNSNATAGNTCGYLRFLSNTSVRAQIHSVVDTGAPFNGNLIFSTGEGTLSERMRIDFSGNLLMGTTLARSFLTFSYGTSTGNGATLVNTNAGNNTTKYNTINFVGTDTVGTGKDSGYIRSIPFDANYVASVLTFATRDADVLAERMSIGSTGIVTMNAYGAGAATFSAAGVISSVSDETWKVKDGVPVNPDSMLKKLEPGYWFYNDEKKETFGADRQLGFYAQNVNAAIGPEAAPEPEEGKPWGYYDRSVLAVVVMSLQKALATIESLETRLAALESN